MRLIDADDTIAGMSDNLPYKASVRRVLMQADTVDAVEVTRCGQCIYSRTKNKEEAAYLEPNTVICTNSYIFEDMFGCMWPTDFCSYGERKDCD